jgi:hypothetical protein
MDYAEIWAEAWTAGIMAGLACRPTPMIVEYHKSKTLYVAEVVDDGACGFAWVKIRPANGKMARWLKAQDKGHKGYNGGWEVSIHDFGQSLERKSATARATADVLCKHGIDATSYSRID